MRLTARLDVALGSGGIVKHGAVVKSEGRGGESESDGGGTHFE